MHAVLEASIRKIFHRHTFVKYLSVNVLAKFHEKTISSKYPINSFKEEGFSRKVSASLHLLKIYMYKHVMPSQRDMSTQKAVNQ